MSVSIKELLFVKCWFPLYSPHIKNYQKPIFLASSSDILGVATFLFSSALKTSPTPTPANLQPSLMCYIFQTLPWSQNGTAVS